MNVTQRRPTFRQLAATAAIGTVSLVVAALAAAVVMRLDPMVALTPRTFAAGFAAGGTFFMAFSTLFHRVRPYEEDQDG